MRFDSLFKARKQIMAAAILMVMLFHLKARMPESPLKILFSSFYSGVDLFFLLSGVGCFFSLREDPDPLRFWRRRALRILPVYLPFILVWIAAKAFLREMDLPSAAADLLGLGGIFRVAYPFNWYVSGLWLSYLLAPALAALAERADTRAKAAAATAALLLLSAVFHGHDKWLIIASRIPIFFVGMCFAAESRRRDSLRRGETILLLLLAPLGYVLYWELQKLFPDRLWDLGLYWYPFLLIIPGVMIALSWIVERLERFGFGRALNRAAVFLGGLTFELYLTHVSVAEQSLPVFFAVTVLGTAALVFASRQIRHALDRRRVGAT